MTMRSLPNAVSWLTPPDAERIIQRYSSIPDSRFSTAAALLVTMPAHSHRAPNSHEFSHLQSDDHLTSSVSTSSTNDTRFHFLEQMQYLSALSITLLFQGG